MTVEATISSIENWIYSNYGARMYETAIYFSGSTNFEIIDCGSSSATPTRYNGDPIADAIWTSSADVNNENSWFVIECTTSLYPTAGLPNWQAKFQWCNAVGFADVSGTSYGQEGVIRMNLIRFAPYGGWDLDPTTPDFSGPSGQLSGQNKKVGIPNFDSINYFIEDAGQFVWGVRNSSVGSGYDFETIVCVLGDFGVIDITKQTMPRLQIQGTGSSLFGIRTNGSWRCEENFWSNTSPSTWTYQNLGIGYEDPSNVWVEEGFKTQTEASINVLSQPSKHTASPKLSVAPYKIVTYTNKEIGYIPLLGKSYGIGFSLFNDKNNLSPGSGECVVFSWDGTTNLL
jgi:hypothetical protein